MTAASGGDGLGDAVSDRLARWRAERVAERLWERDPSLWSDSGAPAADLRERLGWLDLPSTMRGRVDELVQLANDAWADGYRQAAVLGMGGSSLAPELFGDLARAGLAVRETDARLDVRVLDSTHPDAVRAFAEWAGNERTLFVVSSKSGTTTEPLAYHAAMAQHAAGRDFIAITDPGTPLAELAREQGFRAVIDAPSDVGGRYSALTVFGLVPAALAGIDIGALLDRAAAMAEQCHRPATENPGLILGATIGAAALAGRDKLTFLLGTPLAGFGDWVEQLIAESTGKQGTGIVPVVREPFGDPATYASDRSFVDMTLAGGGGAQVAQLAAGLERLGHPVGHIALGDALDIGAEFMRGEVATAAAGMVLGIDPFDQPNVQESKDATKALLATFARDGSLPQQMPLVADEGIAAYGDATVLGDTPPTVAAALRRLFEISEAGDYLAILAYLPMQPSTVERLERLRARVRDRLSLATTLGFGPRFLHSTGQLHKGGPATGLFLQITADPRADLPIPGWRETFATLIAAQAQGDLASLAKRERRALRLHVADVTAGLETLERLVTDALG
jgi:glucose-6-phosphate isomerase